MTQRDGSKEEELQIKPYRFCFNMVGKGHNTVNNKISNSTTKGEAYDKGLVVEYSNK